MLHLKSKKMALSLFVFSMLLSPVITQAETSTGSVAAMQAADQKAALAKKAAARQKAIEEKQKAGGEQLGIEAPKEKTEEK